MVCRVGGGAPGVTGLGPWDPGTPGPQRLLGKLRCRRSVPVLCRHTAVPLARTSPPCGTPRSAPLWAGEEVDRCTWVGRVTRAACLEGGVIRALAHVVGLASSSPLPSEVGGLDSCKVPGARGRQAVSPSASCPCCHRERSRPRAQQDTPTARCPACRSGASSSAPQCQASRSPACPLVAGSLT